MQENINIQNKKASFKYHVQKKYVAGMVLTGLQIKSIRSKKVNIDYAYCSFDLYNINFENAISNNKNNTVKLLLNKRELNKIKKESMAPGLTIIPLKIFLSQNGFAKIQIGISKGKKNYDKRQSIKQREAKVKIGRIMKKS